MKIIKLALPLSLALCAFSFQATAQDRAGLYHLRETKPVKDNSEKLAKLNNSDSRQAVVETEIEQEQLQNERGYNYNLALGFGNGSYENETGTTASAKAYSVEVGASKKIFSLINAAAFMRASYDDYDEDEVNFRYELEEQEALGYDFGPGIRLSYLRDGEGYTWAPFLEAYYGIGKFLMKENEFITDRMIEVETDIDYTKTTLAVGIEWMVSYARPYVKYEWGQVKYDETATVETPTQQGTVIETLTLAENSRNNSFSRFAVGLGFNF
ncbi:MAG: hypothetical protein ACPGJV_13120 [Bacteriovoracaceae bacterium]